MRQITSLDRAARAYIVAVSLFALPATTTLTLAQQAPAAEPELEEVLVRAQKRAAGESVQDVPIAVSAFDERTLQRSFAIDLTDVGRLAPNVTLQPVSTFPNFANFTIRGIGVTTSIRTVDPAVNAYVDGVVMGFQAGTILDTFDTESIEVLRGPQGILFGRNTTGGAVSLRTRRPDGEFGVRAQLTLGNFERIDAAASIEGGFGDRVAAKLAVISRNQDGFFEDNNGGTLVAAAQNPSAAEPGTPRVDQPKNRTLIVKPTFVFDITDNFELTLLGSYFRADGGSAASRAFIPETGRLLRAQTEFGYFPPSDEYEINHDLVGTNLTEATTIVVEANLDAGHGLFTGIVGYRDIDYDTTLDVDGTPFTLLHFPDNRESGDQLSVELRYASTFSDLWDFTVGLYHFEQEFSILERRQITGRAANRAHTLFLYQQGDATQEQDSQAVFGNVNVKFGERWTGFAGVRYTQEDKTLAAIPIGTCTGAFTGCPTNLLTAQRDWSDTSYRIGADFTLTDDLLFYGSYTTGFRSGNFNSRAAAAAITTPADPEEVKSAELGFKSTFAGGRARVNVAAFQTRYDDIQRISQGTLPNGTITQTLLNAGRAEITGIEFESSFTPVADLQLDASIGWIDPEFKEFRGIDANRDGTINAADLEAAKRLNFDRVPEITGYLAATWQLPTQALGGEWSVRGSWSYRSEFDTDVANNPELAQDAYSVFDASLNYRRDAWRVALFGRNLSDEYWVDVKSISQNFQAFGGMPRMYGVEVAVDF
jgi:iron complex outermembrane receptor protein